MDDLEKYILQWEQVMCENKKKSVKDFLEKHDDLIFLFSNKGKCFATTEEGRLIFAKLKNPDSDMPPKWLDEANFVAFNMSDFNGKDRPPQKLFSKDDIKDIKVISSEEVEKCL